MGLIEKKVGDFSIGEAFAIGVTKMLSEQVMSPVIGNGTYMSGAVKIGLAYAVPKWVMKGKIGSVLGTAWAVDGVEDVLNNLFKGGVAQQSSNGMIL